MDKISCLFKEDGKRVDSASVPKARGVSQEMHAHTFMFWLMPRALGDKSHFSYKATSVAKGIGDGMR